MSISDDTDDHNSTFWPGYVDAVVNLAINLLFVIAVLSIVVLGATLQIAELSKKPTPVVQLENLPSKEAYDEALKALEKAEKAKASGEKTLTEKDRLLLSTMTELSEVQAALREARAKLLQLQAALQEANKPGLVVSEASSGLKTVIRQIPSGALITFGSDLVDISASEADNLAARLNSLAPLPGSKWRISVVYPKGVVEATRMVNLRTQSIKNLMLKNGVAPNAIEVRLIETEQTTANYARVTVSLVR
jgi:hypothetical protein